MQEDMLRQTIKDVMDGVALILRQYGIGSPIKKPLTAAELKEDEGPLTKRALIELVCHEGIVLEAYRDIGVTDASDHKVGRYIDNPQTIAKVVEIFKWLLETRYLPDVLKAFEGVKLNEHQLAAAVSFHYNTGAIGRASWVKSFKEGNRTQARKEFLDWRKPPEVFNRRKKEAALFFDGLWSNNGLATVYTQVSKPSYTPKWSSAKRIDITEEL
jgi:lysozyme